jgi:hypothetical protein
MISSEIYPINARAFCRVMAINLLHDPFRPSDGINSSPYRWFRRFPTVVL